MENIAGNLLTEREWEVARLVRDGYSNKQIGGVLKLQESTIKGYVSNIFSKVGVGSRAELAAWVQQTDGDGNGGYAGTHATLVYPLDETQGNGRPRGGAPGVIRPFQ